MWEQEKKLGRTKIAADKYKFLSTAVWSEDEEKERVVRLEITSTDFIHHNTHTTQYNLRKKHAGYANALKLPSLSVKFVKKWNREHSGVRSKLDRSVLSLY